jgi:O-antigen ligase
MIKSPPILRSAPLRLAGAMILVTVLLGALIVIGAPSVEQMMNPIAGAFGKNLTFSGRTLIWAAVLQEAFQHPWLGTGYGAFWQGNIAGSPSGELIRDIGFTVWQSHNGYIDVFNETGIIGLFLLVSNFIAHLVMAGKVSRFDRNSAALHAAIGICFILINLAENNFRMVHAGFTVYFLSSLTLARILLQQKLLAIAPRKGPGS